MNNTMVVKKDNLGKSILIIRNKRGSIINIIILNVLIPFGFRMDKGRLFSCIRSLLDLPIPWPKMFSNNMRI